jgi:hypothetical protein
VDAAEVRNKEHNFDAHTYASYEEREAAALDLVGLDFDDADRFVSFEGVIVVDAHFDRDDVTDDLGAEGFEAETDHEGYAIYADRNDVRAVGVDGGTLVFVGGGDPVDTAEAVVDTKTGAVDRYAEANDDVDLLVSTLGAGTFTRGVAFEDGDQVARGRNVTVHGSTTTVEVVVVYEAADAIDAAEVDAIEDADEGRDDIRRLSASKTGRVATVSWETDTAILGTDDYDDFRSPLGR